MSDAEGASGSAQIAFKKVSKFAKVRRGIGQRKRKASSGSSDSGDGESASAVVSVDRSRKRGPLVQSTSGKAAAQGWTADSGDSADEKERADLLAGFSYESNKAPTAPNDQGATATNEMETDTGADAQAQFERTQEILKARSEGKESDNIYRGLSTYGAKIRKDTAAGNASNGFVRKGPIRAPTNVRMSVRWDYAPDLCKDYKETGYCTFGDTCKFVHDRTDYKHGWELERDWAAGRYGKDDEDPNKYLIEDEEEELPFACFLCRESFNNPVVTKCGHYFCEKCALDNFRKSQKCYVCDKPTGGVFTPAKDLMAKISGEHTKKTKRTADARAEAAAAKLSEGESSGEEGEGTSETPMEKLPDPKEPASDSDDEASGEDKEDEDQ